MITGAIKSQIDQVWNAFWSGGISNPLEVIEQITYLLFIHRLQTFARRVAAVERLKASHRAAPAQLDALFASLQHRAFRGEL